MPDFKAGLQTLLSRFVSKSAEDTQFVENLDWGRMIDLSSSFLQVGVDFEANYTTPESGVCLLSVGAIVEGIYITDKTQTANMMSVGNPQIWPAGQHALWRLRRRDDLQPITPGLHHGQKKMDAKRYQRAVLLAGRSLSGSIRV